mgnify:CR=1 FL=1
MKIISITGGVGSERVELALARRHNKGPDLRRGGPQVIQTTLSLGGETGHLLKTIGLIVYLKYLL